MGLRRSLRRTMRKVGGGLEWTPQFVGDGLATRGKNLTFLEDPAFRKGWAMAVKGNMAGWGGNPPDIRWRAHTALWAARHGMSLEGDFVECGVFLGLLSLTICHALDFDTSGKSFYLFDTFNGLPDDGTPEAKRHSTLYFECYEEASKNFAPYQSAKLVRGILPGTLAAAPLDKIAYLSIDLNHAAAEKAVIEELWGRLSPSAIVLIDDYGFRNHEDQYAMWNDFAASKGVPILTMPTGQGVLIKS
jgi:O-methyltransferase